jgi:hypothetical protein
VPERPDELHGLPEPVGHARQGLRRVEMLQRGRATLQQAPALRQILDRLLVPLVERPDQRLQPFAKRAEAYDQQAGPRLFMYRDEGGDEAVDALGVDELPQVHDEGCIRGQGRRQTVPGVPVGGAGIVGGRNLFEAPDQVFSAF